MVKVEFHLLGRAQICIADQAVDGALLKKDCALLYYLATTRTTQRRSVLAALLWGDYADAAARSNLRKTLSMLRKTLGNLLHFDHDQIGLAAGAWTSDVALFEQQAHAALQSGELDKLTNAANDYHGDFLAGFSVHRAVDFDLWQAQERERLRNLAISVLQALAQRQLDGADFDAASTTYEQILMMEPWREDAHRGKMIALARRGQRGAALHQYQLCIERLAQELAVTPSPETEQLHARIRSGELSALTVAELATTATPDAGWHPLLPLELTPIIGRERELSELSNLFASPDCRLLNLIGPGGIGKTRLALAFAQRVAGDYPAAAMLALAGAQRIDELLSAIVSSLHLAPPDNAEDISAIAAAIDKRNPRLLLVLDNFEQLIPHGLPILAELLAGAPRLRCIMTSRQALNTTWEWRYLVQELAYPDSVDTPDVKSYGAVRLFLSLVRRIRPYAALSSAEIAQVVRICQFVAGMPLGIELAAAQAGHFSLAAIAEMLARDLEHFEATLLDLPPRQRSLQATFESSWAALNAEEQHALAWLSPLISGFSLDAALQITGATMRTLLQLIDRSLVRVHGADAYSLHEVIRRLAESKLKESPGAAEAAFEQYFDYYRNWGRAEKLGTMFGDPFSSQEKHVQLASGLRHLRYLWARTSGQKRSADLSYAIALVQSMLRSVQLIELPNTFELMVSASHSAEYAAALPAAVEPLDIIWLPHFVHQVVDLSDAFVSERSQLLPVLLDACTINQRLMAFPYNLEVALLYYRRDLLEEAGFGSPPRTWDELERMAAEIQARQRSSGQSEFWGYLWQGHPSEHMMGDFLEWLHGEGGGTIVEADGRISIDNPAAVAALERARRWIGVISPPNTCDFYESTVINLWHSGQAAFVRLWHDGYPIHIYHALGDRIGVTVLPAGSVRHAATLGGWPLAVRRESADRQQAIYLIKEIASFPRQRQRALHDQPTLPSLVSLYTDPEVLAHAPILGEVMQLIDNGGLAVRPAKVTGARYPQISIATMKAVSSVLYENADAAEAMADLAATLAVVLGSAE
jgi:DNA-binding SARP family transcriptional activator/predicted ATPase/ABC-type glycerol-3-phosphate transport system substrate-binding protein